MSSRGLHEVNVDKKAPSARGGSPGTLCFYCWRAALHFRLRTCQVCGKFYCGRRWCRARHAQFCQAHRPHWKDLRT